jgi:AcrR family transcriptional regulator
VTPADRPLLQRDAIIDAARELIVAGGLEALSLRRLARGMGVTAPALYAHVRDKQDLLRAVVDIEIEGLAASFEEFEDLDPVERIRAHSRAYVAYARANPELFRVMLLVPPAGLPGGIPLPATTNAFAAAVRAVDEAIATGAIKSDDALLVALTLWSGAHGVATLLQLGFDLPVELEDAMIDEITDRILRGYEA